MRGVSMTVSIAASPESWPDLPLEAWSETCATLHRFTQIVGKVRLTQTPWINHSWHVTLYVTARGLTTSPVPYGGSMFEINFDFVDHHLRIDSSEGGQRAIELRPRSVADFYLAVMSALTELELPVSINTMPNEIQDPIRLDRDE